MVLRAATASATSRSGQLCQAGAVEPHEIVPVAHEALATPSNRLWGWLGVESGAIRKNAGNFMESTMPPSSAESRAPPPSFLRELSALLPRESVLLEKEECRSYESDGLMVYRRLPLAVALPENEKQVVDVLRLCRRHQVRVVARGAGTGLSGGALPHEEGVLLVLQKLGRILHIDPLARTATVQPGVRNLEISQAAAKYGLYYGPDPSSQLACSIGGNVAENSGGVRCLKYGLTVNNVESLRAVTIDGDILELGGPCGESLGYDLLAVLNGSEGMLAVVTEVTVRLLPKPERTCTVVCAFDSVAEAGGAVADLISAGIVPAGLEMMDKLAIRAAEDFVKAGYPLDAAAMLICETDGLAEDAEDECRRACDVLRRHNGRDIRRAVDADERELLWKGRKSAFPAVGRIRPDYYCMDGTIPRRRLAAVLERIADLSEKHGLLCANVFHAADGNLHPLILFDSSVPGETEKALEYGSEILRLCIAEGGTITGEHGVGVEKINEMCLQFPSAELECFRQLKRAFDPLELLNPGKAIPTLNRCAEFGMMHARAGEERFPDLPRF